MVNRTQALVLGFFLMVLVSVVVIRVAAPEVYDQALRLRTGERGLETVFLIALAAFIAVPLAGVLRVPVTVLQLAGVLAAATPTWYVLFQGLIGVVQFAIGLAMLTAYRRAGVWGARPG